MSSRSSIEWTEVTWNPVTGCAKISDGCKHCYAERMAGRLRAMGVEKYRRGFEVAVHENALKEPLGWKRPRLVFVNSMSDLFHEAVSAKFVESVFDVMNRAREHTFRCSPSGRSGFFGSEPGSSGHRTSGWASA